jgi:hypothetical protein
MLFGFPSFVILDIRMGGQDFFMLALGWSNVCHFFGTPSWQNVVVDGDGDWWDGFISIMGLNDIPEVFQPKKGLGWRLYFGKDVCKDMEKGGVAHPQDPNY